MKLTHSLLLKDSDEHISLCCTKPQDFNVIIKDGLSCCADTFLHTNYISKTFVELIFGQASNETRDMK